MASQLNLANYNAINTNICDLLNTGKFASVTFTIYTDGDSINIAEINNVPLKNLMALKISCKQPHVDSQTDETIPGNISIEFDNGSELTAIDNVDHYWYTIEGVPFVPRTF